MAAGDRRGDPGRAPLHALGIGFVGGMVVAMVTRVSRGHSGPLVMDGLDWYVFVGLVATGGVRVAAEIGPLATGFPLRLNLVAALLWLGVLLPWVVRYLPIYVQPRIDGKAG